MHNASSSAKQFIRIYERTRFNVIDFVYDASTTHQSRKAADKFDSVEAIFLAGDIRILP